MLCVENQGLNSRAFLTQFNRKALQRRIPLIGTVELTSRCNLKCVHCYEGGREKRRADNEGLSAHRWMNWIDQFAEAGCLYLLFTGGETLMRSDFPEIYAHACRKGILATVFTNGTLVTERIMETFNAFPPLCIEISLYGATAKTYEKVTEIPGSFDKCMQGIHRIKDAGFNLKLKTMHLTLNSHELEDMRAFASGLGVSFRYDPSVSPRLDGDRSPLQYRVLPEVAVRKESNDPKRMKDWQDLYRRFKDAPPEGDLYECGAGRNMFHVDSCGMLGPCFMVPGAKEDLKENRFYDMWRKEEFMDFRKPGEMPRLCRECGNKVLCGYCPGFFKLETGDERIPSPFLCELGARRGNMVLHPNAEENSNAEQRS